MARRKLSIEIFVGALAMALAAPVGAQVAAERSPPSGAATGDVAASAEAARAEAAEAAEDLTLARILTGVRLSPAQMERLLPFLESAGKQLRDADAAAKTALAGPRPLLLETRRALLAGQNPSSRAEGQIAEQSRIHSGKIRQLRADLVSSLRRTLTPLLSAQQQIALGETARSLDARQRTARIMARSASTERAGRGGDRGGGSVGWLGRALDSARGASDANYTQERMEIAQRLAAPGRRGGRDGGNREAPVPSDPETEARMASILALVDRSRQMSDSDYQSGRADLAMQIWARRSEMGGEGADPAETSEAIDEMLDRYFLSPRMTGAMRARMERRG